MKKKKFFKRLTAICSTACLALFGQIWYAESFLPSAYNVCDCTSCQINMFPYTVDEVDNQNNKFELNFLKIFPLKSVTVNTLPATKVIPLGTPFGTKIYASGAMVISVTDIITPSGVKSPGKKAGIRKGDVIMEIGGQKVSNNQELEKIISASNGQELKLILTRKGQKVETNLTPIKPLNDDAFRAGIWVRDSSVGIGTLTFYNPKNNSFAGLGHGICDTDTGEIIPVGQGEIIEAAITDITKGLSGRPGELQGTLTTEKSMGKVCTNGATGLYGILNKKIEKADESLVKIAPKQDVKKGAAKILTTINGKQPRYYDINIDDVNYNVNLPTKNLKISITDKDLLEKTGGIVQGMSGSPIIQNDALVGAITHVLINNPTKGYGIFAEQMATNSNNIFKSNNKNLP